MNKILLFVGQNKGRGRMEIQGIFSTKKRAIKACRRRMYFIIPMTLDYSLPDKTTVPKAAEYPLFKNR